MTDPNKTVFISYRRSTSQDLARSIFMDLRANGWDAFFDVNTIDSGMFDRIILNQIAARAHFVLVLSPGALERCAHEDDWLRREIEEAMRLNRNIVPVMKEGFSFDTEKQLLPDNLKDLPRFNALRIPHDYFDEAMEKLRGRFLKQPFYGEVVPTPISEETEVEQKITDALTKSARLETMSAEQYLWRGDIRKRDEHDLDGAMADYTEAIRLDPEFALAYYKRGVIHAYKGDFDSAIADYNEVIKLNPKFTKAYSERGDIHRLLGDHTSAIADYTEAIRLDPENAELYIKRGGAYEEIGDWDNAISDDSEALRLNPQDFGMYLSLAYVYTRKGDTASKRKAIEVYQTFFSIDTQQSFGDHKHISSIMRKLEKELE